MWTTCSVEKDIGLSQREDVGNFSELGFDRISLEFTGFRVCLRCVLGAEDFSGSSVIDQRSICLPFEKKNKLLVVIHVIG